MASNLSMMSAVCCAATPSNAMSNPSFGLTSQHNLSRMANHNYYGAIEMDKLLLPQSNLASSYPSTHLQTALQSWNSHTTSHNRSNTSLHMARYSQGPAEGGLSTSCNRTRHFPLGHGNQPDEHMSSKPGHHLNLINSGQSSQHWSQRHHGNVSNSSNSSHNSMATEGLSMTAATSSRGSSSLSLSTSSSTSSSTSTAAAWQLTLASISSDAVYHASRRLTASASLFQSGQAFNQASSGADLTAIGSNTGASSIATRPPQAGAAGPAQTSNRDALVPNSSSIRHRRTCSETFLVPDACLASSLSRSRRLQSNHKRLEEALTEAIPSASSGRVSQRIAQLQQSLYARSWNSTTAVSPNPAPVASSSGGRVSNSLSSLARPLSIDPKKDYSLPLSVDCSIEYDLPRVARPPPGAQPLLLIARRAPPSTSTMQSVGWRKLHQPSNYNYTFQQSHANSHLPHSHTTRPEMVQTNGNHVRPSRSDECGSSVVSGTNAIANVTTGHILQHQQPQRLNLGSVGANNTVFNSMSALSGTMHEPAPVSSSSSDSGRGTDSERNSPGPAFNGPALMKSRSSSRKQPCLPQSGGHQMPWNHMPAPPVDSGLGLDPSSSSWMAVSHLAMRPSAMNRSLVAAKPLVRASSTSSSSHHGQVQQPTSLVPRLASGAGTEAAHQRSGANESGVVQCQCCQRPQQEALAKSASALASMAAVPPRWAPYSTHIRHACPPTAQQQQQQQHQHHQQLHHLQQEEQLKSQGKAMLGTGHSDAVGATVADWNTLSLQDSQSFVMPRSMAVFHV